MMMMMIIMVQYRSYYTIVPLTPKKFPQIKRPDEPLQKCYQNLDGDDINQICHGRGELAFERNW